MFILERRKDKYKDYPPDLQAQWEKDRETKAENKRLRAEARFLIASDSLVTHKGGKKGKKAMLAASRQDPTIMVIPNRVIDMVTLVQQIRRFLDNLGGPTSMSLPPTNKATRKAVHELGTAFGLKSVSKGKGDARYTTLLKTTRSRSGYGVDEAKIGRIVKRSGGKPEFVNAGYGAKSVQKGPRHTKDGEEVGKVPLYPVIPFLCCADIFPCSRLRLRLAKVMLDSRCWHSWVGLKGIILESTM